MLIRIYCSTNMIVNAKTRYKFDSLIFAFIATAFVIPPGEQCLFVLGVNKVSTVPASLPVLEIYLPTLRFHTLRTFSSHPAADSYLGTRKGCWGMNFGQAARKEPHESLRASYGEESKPRERASERTCADTRLYITRNHEDFSHPLFPAHRKSFVTKTL